MASIPMSLTCNGAQQTAGSRQDKKSLKSCSYDPHFLFWHLQRTLAPLWAVLCGSVIAISTHTTKKIIRVPTQMVPDGGMWCFPPRLMEVTIPQTTPTFST